MGHQIVTLDCYTTQIATLGATPNCNTRCNTKLQHQMQHQIVTSNRNITWEQPIVTLNATPDRMEILDCNTLSQHLIATPDGNTWLQQEIVTPVHITNYRHHHQHSCRNITIFHLCLSIEHYVNTDVLTDSKEPPRDEPGPWAVH